LNPRSFLPCLALFAATFGAQLASAQQAPAKLIISQGYGQLICNGCQSSPQSIFERIGALVLDANNAPLVGYPVTWNVTSGVGTIDIGQTSETTFTDATGTALVRPDSISGVDRGFGFTQVTTITAQAGNLAAVTYNETGILPSPSGVNLVTVYFTINGGTVPQGNDSSVTGQAGSTGTPFKVVVAGNGGVQNVSVRLVNALDGTSGPSSTSPSMYCQTGAGADPWSVLTDASGTATCTPVFGPVTGNAQMFVEVGGVPAGVWGLPGQGSTTPYNPDGVIYTPGTDTIPLPAFQVSTTPININVTAATIKSLTVTSGNNQSAGSGQALANPLVATISGTSGPLANQQVNWSATPTGSVTFGSNNTLSDSTGKVSNTVTFTAAASGPVTIKATSNTTSSISATFTETAVPPITVSGLVKAGGDAQSAVISTAFANPLQVQVATSSGSVAGQTVSFTATGPVSISSSSASTNASGIAQVTATAGATTGNATVTASIGGQSVTFNLTVIPQGPSVTANSFVNGADQQKGSISACSLATIQAANIAPTVSGTATAPVVGPMPYLLGGVQITFNASTRAPILSASTNAVTFLVPCDLTAGSVPVTVASGPSTSIVNVTLLPASPGIFQSLQPDGSVRAVVERPDGSFASNLNPARRGETVTGFFTGLGTVSPIVATNALPIPGTPSKVNGQVIVGINNAGVLVTSSQLTATQAGVYAVSFQIPQDAPQDNNVVFSIGVVPGGSNQVYYSAGSLIPIQ
jgi:uncharacterized protein (TIGR03437 family)